jgi:hypothetical protein
MLCTAKHHTAAAVADAADASHCTAVCTARSIHHSLLLLLLLLLLTLLQSQHW